MFIYYVLYAISAGAIAALILAIASTPEHRQYNRVDKFNSYLSTFILGQFTVPFELFILVLYIYQKPEENE